MKKKIIHSIGTDPEFFILNEEGKPVNAENMFPGTKDEPHMLESGSGLQTDNVAVEFASAVAHDVDALIKNIRSTFKEIKVIMPPGHSLDATPTAKFEDSELQSEQALKFGCDPAFCAWDLIEKPQPDAEDTNMRSTGGHIHIGKVEGDGNDFLLEPYGKINVVKIMDAFHGIISVILDNSPESVERRKLYGTAGEHRPKDYGVEYRTLSSFWLKSPSLVMLIDSLTHDALKAVREGYHNDIIDEIGDDKIRDIINKGNVEEANKMVESTILKHMSEDSKHFFKECSENIHKYVLEVEWEL